MPGIGNGRDRSRTVMDHLPRPRPVKTANSGRSRLPIRPRTGPLDERPIGGERETNPTEDRKSVKAARVYHQKTAIRLDCSSIPCRYAT